jgi:hypothetical protein
MNGKEYMRSTLLVVLVLLGGGIASGRPTTPAVTQVDPCSPSVRAVSVKSARAVLDLLRIALRDHGGVGRVYYEANAPVCSTDYWGELPFPEIRLKTPPKNDVGMAALREALRDNPGATITQDPSGMPRITFGTVSDDILRTRIAKITLDTDARFNSFDAIGAILSSKEVVETIRARGYVRPSRVHQGLTQQPMPGVPRLPSSMTDVTLDQALDAVARTFKGIVLYATCSKPRQLVVDFSD